VLNTWALKFFFSARTKLGIFYTHVHNFNKISTWLGWTWYVAYLGASSQCKAAALCSEQGLDIIRQKCSPARSRAGRKREPSVSCRCCTVTCSGKSLLLHL